jgi:hypothetical protein
LPPTNVKATVQDDGLNVTLTFNKGQNSTHTAIKNANTGQIIKTTTESTAYLKFGSYSKTYTIHLYGMRDGIKSENYTVVTLKTGSESLVIEGVKRGDEGSSVSGIQEMLFELGYLKSTSHITGYFGEITENAVKEYQKDTLRTVTNIVDIATKRSLADNSRMHAKSMFEKVKQESMLKKFSINTLLIVDKDWVLMDTSQIKVVTRYSYYPTTSNKYASLDLVKHNSINGTLSGLIASLDSNLKLKEGEVIASIDALAATIAPQITKLLSLKYLIILI